MDLKKNMIPDSDLANLDPKTTFRWNLGSQLAQKLDPDFQKMT